jgi:hypothetical protein
MPGKNTKTATTVTEIYGSILSSYQQVSATYLRKCVMPHADKLHGLSSAVHGSCSQDINLKLFDALGRTALFGIWCYWQGQQYGEGTEERDGYLTAGHNYADALKQMLNSNPTLCLPLKDDQCIDIALAVLLMRMQGDTESVEHWLAETLDRAVFSYRSNGTYPCVLGSYSELIDHPQRDEGYRKRATEGSILYPFIAVIAVIAAQLGCSDTFNLVKDFKLNDMEHSNFQYWFPDATSEAHLYANDESHGATLSDLVVIGEPEDLLQQVFDECDHMPHYGELSAVKLDLWPLVLTACRHYRLPVPLHLFRAEPAPDTEGTVADKSDDTG